MRDTAACSDAPERCKNNTNPSLPRKGNKRRKEKENQALPTLSASLLHGSSSRSLEHVVDAILTLIALITVLSLSFISSLFSSCHLINAAAA
jgi:hypothetical protein